MHLDLNLLVALDVLLEEESVQAAADRLHLSSPAMSRTLGRIRTVTKDQVLVRTGRTMTPTPYAVAVRDQVHRLVQQAQAVLLPRRDLDLTALVRTFTLQCHDAVTSALAPGLIAAAQREAPKVVLRFLAETSGDTHELRQGRVDLVIGSQLPSQPDTRWETLGEGHLAVALRRDHPLAGGPLDLGDFAGADHVIVSRRGRLFDPVDAELETLGLRRRVIATAPTGAAALRVVQETDALTTVPEIMSRHLVDALDLRMVALPLALPALPLIYAWHQRNDDDPAHSWLRDQLRRVAGQLA